MEEQNRITLIESDKGGCPLVGVYVYSGFCLGRISPFPRKPDLDKDRLFRLFNDSPQWNANAAFRSM